MNTNRLKLYSFIGLSLIFILNDFLFMMSEGYIQWLLLDYGSRILALSVIFYLIKRDIISLSELKLNFINFKLLFFYTLILSIFGVLIFELLEPLLSEIFKDTNLVTFPKIENNIIYILDLTLGLALVALSEELIFRGLVLNILNKFSKINIILLSSFIFSIIHWSAGVNSLIIAFIIGVLFMTVTLRVNSIYPVLISHFVINFWLFI